MSPKSAPSVIKNLLGVRQERCSCSGKSKKNEFTKFIFQTTNLRLQLTLVDELYGIDSSTLTHETFICTEMRDSAQILLDAYVRLQGLNISQVRAM